MHKSHEGFGKTNDLVVPASVGSWGPAEKFADLSGVSLASTLGAVLAAGIEC